ncbi:hypothetical protein [Streptomyces sp. ISL-11]|uniref:DUF7848 domain-containing protein n=1 Tax=Streptomyces sp. ISL-11 TaxID=2819174 RepID=UPI001BE9ECC8|nr:hypothetical protein [Streptomyces sp. ISL-11]MBT2387472.1 hypothetical protein [Streptomyces sp. ISL-11]
MDWLLELDTSQGLPVFEMRCTECDAVSEASEMPALAQEWALGHAGRTRHTRFRAEHTSYFQATQVGE